MKSSLGLWSPGVPALAVYVRPEDYELDWDQYLNRLAKRVQDLANLEENPVRVMEKEWGDQIGTTLGLSSEGAKSVAHSAAFEELLAERHGLHPSDFPMRVKADPDLEDEGLPTNLMEWVEGVRYGLG